MYSMFLYNVIYMFVYMKETVIREYCQLQNVCGSTLQKPWLSDLYQGEKP